MIEALLIKIAAAVFKKAAFSGLAAAATAYEIYSIFDTISDASDCIETVNDCSELGVCGIQVVSESVAEPMLNRLVNIGNTTFEVSKSSSGIYVASSLTKRFAANGLNFPSFSKKELKISSSATIPTISGTKKTLTIPLCLQMKNRFSSFYLIPNLASHYSAAIPTT